ncbi:odorant receptor 10-like [Andrena cerasifolii]|uniref:odorant receptor 10-like n=1 Tax=Andrena cerasifolii TaxID=2819439 RepID=UPI0040377C63
MLKSDDDLSLMVASIFMKISGLWLAADDDEQRRRNITLAYTISLILFSVYLQTTDFYHSVDDIGDCLYIACNILSASMSLFKIVVLLLNRNFFFALVVYLQRKFLRSNYDVYEETVMNECKRTCFIFITVFTFFTQATLASYVIRPIVANIGRNASDRILPFRMWMDLPLTVTPYFEIMSVIQILALYQIGVCYCCFDNFLCITNLHVASQFRILQYRLAHMNNARMNKEDETSDMMSSYRVYKYSVAFKGYVKEHQALIAYCDKLDEVFSAMVLGQVLMFSLIICLDGYQILMAEATFTRRIIFIFHLLTSISQLFMFTYSCDCLMHESANIATAMYSSPWIHLPNNKEGRMLQKDLILVAMRSRSPCCLTAYGFFPVTLETYTKVLSTAVSYFTLLRQSTENVADS